MNLIETSLEKTTGSHPRYNRVMGYKKIREALRNIGNPEGHFTSDHPLAPESSHDTPLEQDSELKSKIESQVYAAHKAGKPFAYGREGGVEGRDRELHAKTLADKLGVPFHPFSLEHPDTDIEGDFRKSSLGQHLIKNHGEEGAEGIRHAFLGGQGNMSFKDNGGANWLKRRGIDPEDKDSMYNACFPEDIHPSLRGSTEISQAQLDINRMRREGVNRTIADKVKQGFHVGGTFGGGHWIT